MTLTCNMCKKLFEYIKPREACRNKKFCDECLRIRKKEIYYEFNMTQKIESKKKLSDILNSGYAWDEINTYI
jgi:hypothetical protein